MTGGRRPFLESSLDRRIATLQLRLTRRRSALRWQLAALRHRLPARLTSPAVLLTAVGLGFAIGHLGLARSGRTGRAGRGSLLAALKDTVSVYGWVSTLLPAVLGAWTVERPTPAATDGEAVPPSA